MNLFKLKALKDGSTVFQCVVSSEDMIVSVNYWLDQGCLVHLSKF